jgi:hypothetical protein
MTQKRKFQGSLLALIGYILSPLSWWNDPFVNFPLAAAVAWVVAWFYPPAFQVTAVAAYWMTNVVGLVLMHKGARMALRPDDPRPNRRRQLLIELGVSLGYTLLSLLLIKLRVLQPVTDYFGKRG